MSEKTEAPSARRLQKAVEDGQVPRSRLMTGGAVSVAAVWTLLSLGADSAAAVKAYAQRLLGGAELSAEVALAEGLWVLARVAGPPLAVALLAALVASAIASGLHFQPALIEPKLERVDPAAGLKRMFSAKQLGEVVRGVIACAVIGWVAWRTLREVAPAALGATRGAATAAAMAFLSPVATVVSRLLGVVAVLGALDYALARRRHLKDLRMSREELKQEHKDAEGDPRHRAHRKALQRQLAQRGPARGVQKATAVVVNPTHIAVALRYSPDECDAPYLVARGRDTDAFAIRSEAQRLGIPVVRDIPLARSLIHYDVGDEIPEELYRAAAAVLHAASQMQQTDARPAPETP